MAKDQVDWEKEEKSRDKLSEDEKEKSRRAAKANIRELLAFAVARGEIFGKVRTRCDAEKKTDNGKKHRETVYYSDMKYVGLFLWSRSYRD